MAQEEDAAELVFGEDLDGDADEDGTICLSNAEVAIIMDQSKQEAISKSTELSHVFLQTDDYVSRFSGTKDPVSNSASVEALREALGHFRKERAEGEVAKLHSFEIACLANLAPESVEETHALIPSIAGKFREDEVTEILEIVDQNINAALG
jgi:DNA-directed RNA polymerase II subunit RPB4